MKTHNLTVCIISKNEEDKIATLIKSLNFANEIILVDDYSIDKTVKIAKKLGAKVYLRHLSNNFSSQRNFALRKATNKWVLFIDADEYISKSLQKEIIVAIENDDISGYFLIRQDEFMGRVLNHAEWGNQQIMRLAQKKAGKWTRSIHETWKIKGKTSTLKAPLIHKSHESIESFLNQIAFHSSLHSKEKSSAQALQIFIYPAGKFIMNWVVKGGYKDGTRGLIYALFMSFHSFLAWSNVTLKNEK